MLSQLTQNLLSIDSDTAPTFSAFLRFSRVANPSIPPIKLLLVQTLITLGELKSPENRQDRSEGEELLRIDKGFSKLHATVVDGTAPVNLDFKD